MSTSIQKYLAFIKTVEYGSFTKAAEILNYSQSGISRMINDLEAQWGISLLERNRNGVRLTSDGLKVLPLMTSVCAEFEKLQQQIDDLNGLQSGLIRIGTFSSVTTHWLPNIIKKFQNYYPNIDYEILLGDYAEIEEWIRIGRVDCGFLGLPTLDEFETTALARDKMLVVMPENHPLTVYDKVPLNELENYPFLLLEKRERGEVSEILEKHHMSPKVHFITWDDYTIMSMVESGLGISILPELILKRTSYNVIAKELEKPAYRIIGLAVRSKKNSSVAVRRFMEFIQGEVDNFEDILKKN